MSRSSFTVNLHSILCLNVKELLAQSRRYTWSLSNSNEIRTHNHLVRKRTLNHLAKLAKVTNLFSQQQLAENDKLWKQISLLSLKLQIWRLLLAGSFLTFRQSIECGFTLKLVGDMIITYSQMHRTDKYLQHSSIIWPVWLNGGVFVCELSGCGFESCCSCQQFII